MNEKEMREMAEKYLKMKQSNQQSYERRNAYRTLMVEKGEKAGIKVTQAEVDAYVKARKK